MADALIPFLLASLAGLPCSGLDMDKWQQVVSDVQLGRMIGNSMSVNVVERILCRLLPAAGLASEDACRDRWLAGGPAVT